MQDRDIAAPDGLIEVIAVLGIAAGVQHAGPGALVRPEAFAEVIDAGPHEAAHDIGTGADELPELFRLEGLGIVGCPSPHALRRLQAVIPARAVDRDILRAQQQPVGMFDLFLLIEGFRALAPAVSIVDADNIELLKEFGVRGHRLGLHHITGLGDRSCAVQAVAEAGQHAGILPAVLNDLLPHFVADRPHHDRRMVAVPLDHVGQVLARTGVKPLGIAAAFMRIGAKLLALHGMPFVKRFIHHAEAHFIREVQERRVRRVMAHAQRIAAHGLQFFQSPLPDFSGHRRPDAPAVMVEAHAAQDHLASVEGKAVFVVKGQRADAKRRHDFIGQGVPVVHPGDRLIQAGRLKVPDEGALHFQDLHRRMRRQGRQEHAAARRLAVR